MKSKEEESGEEFIIPHIRPIQTTSIVNQIEIKHEEVDFQHNTSIKRFDKGQEKDLDDFYLDLLQCKQDCETCQKYIRILNEHVRATHAPPHPIQDPLFIDPIHIDVDPPDAEQYFSVEIKSEVEDDIGKMECCEEESKTNYVSTPDFELETESRSEIDPDYSPSTRLIRNVRRQGFPKAHTSSDSPMLNVSKPFKCNDCDKSFKDKGKLKIHQRIHTGEKPFKCELCEKCFAMSDSLILHKRFDTGERPHKCDQCEKCFTQKCNLIEHIERTHTTEKPFQCDECEKTFSLHSTLNTHKMFHTGERPNQCDECEKCFAKLSNLISHKETHTGEKPFKCDMCEKGFTRAHILVEHKRIHTGDIPYKCDECGRSFTQKNTLTGHKKTHTGERPFKCDVCMKSFSRNSHLNRHMRVYKG